MSPWLCPSYDGMVRLASDTPLGKGLSPMARRITSARSEAADFAHGLPDEFLSCRDFGHSWAGVRARWVPAERAWHRVMQCRRCQSERIQVLSQTGAILSGRYDYAEGYLTHGIGRLTGTDRDALRLESCVRVSE